MQGAACIVLAELPYSGAGRISGGLGRLCECSAELRPNVIVVAITAAARMLFVFM